MRKHTIALSCVLTLAAGVAFAAMGTGNGLPKTWSMPATNGTTVLGYGAQANLAANPGSAMCVDCHTVNPSARITAPADNAGLTPALLRAERGTHFVMNMVATTTGEADLFGQTNAGGYLLGLSNANGAKLTTPKYEKLTAWANTGLSKYQNSAVTVLQSQTGAAGDMICESCHNLIKNEGNSLILGKYYDNEVGGTTDICTSCHNGAQTSFHDNGNLVAFDGTSRKRHHVLTGDQLIDNATHYNGGGTASLMWAPTASDRYDANWCTGGTPGPYGTIAAPSVQLNITTGANIAFRDACNAAGQGTYAIANVLGDIKPLNATTVACSNCHRPHNAMTGAGAFIFRSGTNTPTEFAGKFDTTTRAKDISGAPDAFGMRRQSDVGAHSGNKVYGEYLPLCIGCHRGYGN